MSDKINVLDHGFVRLVSCMQPVDPSAEENDMWFGDLEIVRNARVSYDADWREGDEKKDQKLIDYLYKNRHTSPFEAMVFTFEVKAPLFVLRQWHRHRTWSYNEVSARYTELPEEFYLPALSSVTTQHQSNKQMRTDDQHPTAHKFVEELKEHSERAFELYQWMLADGYPRELCRTVLPLNTYSRMFATVDLHNLFHFCRLRLHPHAQYEIRVYAQAMLDLVNTICPYAVKAFKEGLE
ncbi:FAD-dependent thymidylate synthase [Methylocaldum sp.]|uniref:FAD-dependent thymidylate synthase n=1 Tax=Methylocaldum sp. TaxID=1969727 RepID=UPI002D4B3C34|nr:FAD-dependent thymidylate synthase [Methylocaldum sp.]HYE38166.1 FAD-dependent thymidylate synthase [Methylocaldum sp.]